MDAKTEMHYTDHINDVFKVMTTRGLLLASWKYPGEANAMTIGWGMIGSIWGKPIFQVLVRPSRYTYQLLLREQVFSVNVLPKTPEMKAALQLCGTVSGARRDKLSEANLTVEPGPVAETPIVTDSVIHYECHILHVNNFLPETMVPDIRKGSYPSGDYHRVYWGEIVDCRVDSSKLDTLL